MKASFVQKFMVCMLVASLVTAPVIGVSATESGSSKSAVVEAVSESSSDAESGTMTVAEAVSAISATSSVAGVESAVSGAYYTSSVEGVAVATALTSLAEGYGLASNEKPYVMVWDLDAKKSNLAKQVIDLAAASQGAEVGPMLNIELGKKSGGNYSLLSSDGPNIRLSIGIPASFVQADKTFAVVRVQPGGVVTILKDLDDNPNTVTFDTTGGSGAYAVIKY